MSARNSYNVAPIPGDNNGGSGGGNGPNADGGIPIGTVLPFAGSIIPAKWLLCDGTEYRNDTAYEALYNTIFFTYGVNGGDSSNAGIGAYSYTGNTLTFNMTAANLFCKVGTIVRPFNFVLATGQDINAAYVLITFAPAIGGTGSATGTFVNAISGTGSGNASVTANVNRASFAVPDLRLKNPVGAQVGTINLASSGGSATTTITADNLPQHNHGIDNGLGYSAAGLGNGPSSNFIRTNFVISRTLASQTYLNDNSTLTSNSAISTRNPYVGMNYIIHAQM